MKTADELLRRLLDAHFYGTGLEWSYVEGVTLASVDPELARGIAAWRAQSTLQPADVRADQPLSES